eukprot:TRINITY_DN4987_c0_g1_i2.p1 TRINITY_DN4987_c0_g1~~TRINITY_DN4987_c0_g1_i2.p1  ORF type:complete len:290 (-),score=53.33 TRINITY_DN4987_c0_g1_i2:606-1475(-)
MTSLPVFGFIGCGTITECTIEGILLDYNDESSKNLASKIIISKRSSERSSRLLEKYPNIIEICEKNQQIIDSSDILFLSTLPKDSKKIYGPLNFKEDQIICTFIASIGEDTIEDLVFPAKTVIRAVPVPPIRNRLSPTIICPGNEKIEEIFNLLGKAVVVNDMTELASLQSITGLMAPYYQFLNYLVKHLSTQYNVSEGNSLEFVNLFFHGLSMDAYNNINNNNTDFEQIVSESQTPGGLNEEAVETLMGNQWYDQLSPILGNLVARLTKTSVNKSSNNEDRNNNNNPE